MVASLDVIEERYLSMTVNIPNNYLKEFISNQNDNNNPFNIKSNLDFFNESTIIMFMVLMLVLNTMTYGHDIDPFYILLLPRFIQLKESDFCFILKEHILLIHDDILVFVPFDSDAVL